MIKREIAGKGDLVLMFLNPFQRIATYLMIIEKIEENEMVTGKTWDLTRQNKSFFTGTKNFDGEEPYHDIIIKHDATEEDALAFLAAWRVT